MQQSSGKENNQNKSNLKSEKKKDRKHISMADRRITPDLVEKPLAGLPATATLEIPITVSLFL